MVCVFAFFLTSSSLDYLYMLPEMLDSPKGMLNFFLSSCACILICILDVCKYMYVFVYLCVCVCTIWWFILFFSLFFYPSPSLNIGT